MTVLNVEEPTTEECLAFCLELARITAVPVGLRDLGRWLKKGGGFKMDREYLNREVPTMLRMVSNSVFMNGELKARFLFLTGIPMMHTDGVTEMEIQQLMLDIERGGTAKYNTFKQLEKYEDNKGDVLFHGQQQFDGMENIIFNPINLPENIYTQQLFEAIHKTLHRPMFWGNQNATRFSELIGYGAEMMREEADFYVFGIYKITNSFDEALDDLRLGSNKEEEQGGDYGLDEFLGAFEADCEESFGTGLWYELGAILREQRNVASGYVVSVEMILDALRAIYHELVDEYLN